MVNKLKSSLRKFLCGNDKQAKKPPTEELYKIIGFAVYVPNIEGVLFRAGITNKMLRGIYSKSLRSCKACIKYKIALSKNTFSKNINLIDILHQTHQKNKKNHLSYLEYA